MNQLDCAAFFETLRANGVSFYAGVPDSLLKDICAYVTDNTTPAQHVITANEGGAIALAAGHFLATGELPLVYMQNSGLGNTVNPLTSLTDEAVYGIPMLLMIGWRGEPGKKDEPQHVKMGDVTIALLDAIGVDYTVLPDDADAAASAVAAAATAARERNVPHALVVRKGTFAKYALQATRDVPYGMSREEALGAVLDRIPPNALIVSTTGKPSRELFEHRERRGEPHDTDFLTVGCMGHSSQIALGVALRRPERPVWCIDGDGAVLMHMGGLASIGSLAPANYTHVVLNNGAHDSVGGQPTVGFDIDIVGVARACGYGSATRVDSTAAVREALTELTDKPGPHLLEIRVKTGARADLGRPTMKPQQLKQHFMRAARGER